MRTGREVEEEEFGSISGGANGKQYSRMNGDSGRQDGGTPHDNGQMFRDEFSLEGSGEEERLLRMVMGILNMEREVKESEDLDRPLREESHSDEQREGEKVEGEDKQRCMPKGTEREIRSRFGEKIRSQGGEHRAEWDERNDFSHSVAMGMPEGAGNLERVGGGEESAPSRDGDILERNEGSGISLLTQASSLIEAPSKGKASDDISTDGAERGEDSPADPDEEAVDGMDLEILKILESFEKHMHDSREEVVPVPSEEAIAEQVPVKPSQVRLEVTWPAEHARSTFAPLNEEPPHEMPVDIASRFAWKKWGGLAFLALIVLSLLYVLFPLNRDGFSGGGVTFRVQVDPAYRELAGELVEGYLSSSGWRCERGPEGENRWSIRAAKGNDSACNVEILTLAQAASLIHADQSREDLRIACSLPREEETVSRTHPEWFDRERTIGLDALVVLAHPENPIRRATIAQLRSILSGLAREWSDGRSIARPVSIVLPAEETLTRRMLEQAFSLDTIGGNIGTTCRTDDEIVVRVRKDRTALGFVRRSSLKDGRPPNGTALVAVGDAGTGYREPSDEECRLESYPLTVPVMMYLPAGEETSIAESFACFVESDEGQEIVRRRGLCDLRLRVIRSPHRNRFPAAVEEITAGATRLSTDLRMRIAASDFDARAGVDFERIASFVKSQSHRGRGEVILVGFTDRMGGNAAEEIASATLAERAADRLRERGVHVARSYGMGAACLVTEDESDVGRRRNRRVEVWFRPVGESP
ncbi:MAG: hypothetical protein QHI48_03835 [Bacteroidota bacterium]|nr:hypothetical protein [Bacteroidota bacterium]